MSGPQNGSGGGTESVAELRRQVQRLKQQLEELSNASDSSNGRVLDRRSSSTITVAPPEKSGYLFKWKDREIGWGGTKWGLRFVRLDHGQLSYFKSHEEKSPRYILTLKNCAVRDEGSKVNKRHTVRRSSITAGAPGSPGLAGSLGSSEEKQHEVGSHFHVFSIYQRPSDANTDGENEDDDQDIIPQAMKSLEVNSFISFSLITSFVPDRGVGLEKFR